MKLIYRHPLQEKSLFGCEPKPLPYLLCQMNLLLHGLDAPQIDPGNALRHKLAECLHTATSRLLKYTTDRRVRARGLHEFLGNRDVL